MKEKYRVYKNVLVICLAFLCQFTAFNGIGNLQSSINCEDGLGTATLASIYAGLGSFFRVLPQFCTITSKVVFSTPFGLGKPNGRVTVNRYFSSVFSFYQNVKSGIMFVPANINHSKNWTQMDTVIFNLGIFGLHFVQFLSFILYFETDSDRP